MIILAIALFNKHLHNSYFVSDNTRKTLHIVTVLILLTLWDSCDDYFHIADKETQA